MVLDLPPPPRLSGRHFRVTVVQEPGFVDFLSNGQIAGGYCITILQTIAAHANFTYELLPPSGFGSLCQHAQNDTVTPYSEIYRSQYLCGQSDVNDVAGILANTNVTSEYASDMYMGLYYVTPERMLQNQFSISFHPPTTGALTLFGTATEIESVPDLIHQQAVGKQGPVCIQTNTALEDYIQTSFPDLATKPYDPATMGDLFQSFLSGDCEIQILDNPIATRFIMEQYRQNQCQIRGKPLGVITAPLTFGFSQYAIGIRKDLERNVVDTIDYWMNYLMTCSPSDDACESFSQYYPQAGGTGQECGYVAFPPPAIEPEDRLLSQGAIAGLVVGISTLLFCGLFVWHYYRLQKQKRRYKKRFVQQIARNISIGPKPREIPAEKLAEEIQHISSRQNGIINKEDLRKWMFDIKLNFLSDKDFDALWNAIDVDGRGVVEPLEFFVFLSLCGPEFETVHKELSGMPKGERLKWASRRLTNYKLRGEAGVRKLEHDLERRSRQNVGYQRTNMAGTTPSARLLLSADEVSLGADGTTNSQSNKKKTKKSWLPGLKYGPPIDEDQTPTEFFTTYKRSLVPSIRSSLSSMRSSAAAPSPGEDRHSSDGIDGVGKHSVDGRSVTFQMDQIDETTTETSRGEPLDNAAPDVPEVQETDAEKKVVGRSSTTSNVSEMTYDA